MKDRVKDDLDFKMDYSDQGKNQLTAERNNRVIGK